MARKLAVEIVGSAASLKAALGSAAAATTKFAGDYKAAFAGMTDATLQLAVAEDRLAMANARFGVGTQGAARATVAYRKEMEALSSSTTTAMQNIGRTLTTFVTIPVAIIGYASTKMAVEFNRNMVMIQTQAGASSQEVKNLSKEVLELAKVSPQGPVALAQGLYHLESLGLRGAKAMEALRISSMAAGMGIADIESVATALGGAVVTEVRGTKDYNEAMGTLNATIGQGNMRMEDMAAALGTGILPAAKNAGLSLDQVGAALAVLTDRGLSAENAGTRLRMTFAFMQAPSRKAQQALSDMGIDAEYMSQKLRGPNGLMEVLTMLNEGMKRVGAARGSSDILKAFGGGRSGAGILTLVQSLDTSVSSYQGKLEAIQKNQANFGKNMKAYMETPSYKLSVALNTLQSNMTKLGTSLTPLVLGMAKAISTIADAFTALPGPVKRDMGIIIGLLAVGGPLFLAIAATRRMIKAIATAFQFMQAKAATSIAMTNAEMGTLTASTTTATAATGRLAGAMGALRAAGPLLLSVYIGVEFAYPWLKQLFESGLGADYTGTKPGAGVASQKQGTMLYQSDGRPVIVGPNKELMSPEAYYNQYGEKPAGTRRNYNPNQDVTTGKVPRTVLPRSMKDAVNAARLSASLKDDIGIAKSIEAWWAEQLKLAESVYGKGSEAYSMILDQLAGAHETVGSLESQYASSTKKSTAAADKAARARAKIPAGLQNELYAAQAAKNHAKELAALIKIKKHLESDIKIEKNITAKNLERQKLSQVNKQIASVRKGIGDSIIAKDEARVKAAQNVSTSAYVSALLKLKADIEKQIKIQKDNVDLTNKLASVTDDLANARQSVVDQLKSVMGELGGGPFFGGGDNTLRLFALGVRHTAEQYTKDIRAQIAAFKLLQKNISTLKLKGAPEALLDELRGQGMKAFPEVFALANADKGTLAKFFAAYKERQKIIQKTATAEIQANVVNINTAKIVTAGHPPPARNVLPGSKYDLLRPPRGVVRKAAGGPVHGSGTGDSVPALLTPGEWVLNKRQQHKLGRMLGRHPGEIAPQLFGLGGIVKGAAHWLGEKTNWKGMGEKKSAEYLRAHPQLWQGKGANTLKGIFGPLFDPFYQLAKRPGLGTGVGALGMAPIPGMKGVSKNQILFSIYNPRTGKSEPISVMPKKTMKNWAKPDPLLHKLSKNQKLFVDKGSASLKRLIKEETGTLRLGGGTKHQWTTKELARIDRVGGLVMYHDGPWSNLKSIAQHGLLPGGGGKGPAHPGQDWTPNVKGVYGHQRLWRAREEVADINEYASALDEMFTTYRFKVPKDQLGKIREDFEGSFAYTDTVPPSWISVLHPGKRGWVPIKDVVKRLAKEETGTLGLPFGPKRDYVRGYQGWGSMFPGVGAFEINSILRGLASKRPSRAHLEMIRGLDSMMEPLPSMTVYRGLPLEEALGVKASEIKTLKGKVVSDKGFVSASKDLNTALEFADVATSMMDQVGAVMKIRIPKGAKGIDTPAWLYDQQEVILPRGSKFRIDHAMMRKVNTGGGMSIMSEAPFLDATLIPKMAKGGIVSRPTLAMIGERGPEAVVPLRGGMGENYYFGTVNVHGVEDADALMEELRKKGRSAASQSRGRMKQNKALR